MIARLKKKRANKKPKRWSVRLHGEKPPPKVRPPRAKYDNETLSKAFEQIAKGRAFQDVSVEFGIPTMTLHDKYHGKYLFDRIGRPTRLPITLELLLVSILQCLASWCFGLQFFQIQDLIKGYLVKTNQTHLFPPYGEVGRKWFRCFLKRHGDQISRRKAQPLASNRASAISRECIQEFFDLLRRKYQEYGLHGMSELLWNVDESGYGCDQKKACIICKKGIKNPHLIQGNNEKVQYTVQGTGIYCHLNCS